MPKIATIVGSRPQFVKTAVLSRALLNEQGPNEVMIHTGQHYDVNMSEIFFRELEIPKPHYNLGVGSGTHAYQTGQMLQRLEEVLVKENPALVVVLGDTNSTLAGALAAAKMGLPVAHVEAGLRSFNPRMAEEINRIIVDHISEILFAPTENAENNLAREGLKERSRNVGDVMYDSVLHARAAALASVKADEFPCPVEPRRFYLMTVHRAENTDHPERLMSIIRTIEKLEFPVVFPAHPRTVKSLAEHRIVVDDRKVHVIPPVRYFQMLFLTENARKVLTDSGGVQKEAYFLGTPCVTLREETEWPETLEGGWNVVAGVEEERILKAVRQEPSTNRRNAFGDGQAGNRIARILSERLR